MIARARVNASVHAQQRQYIEQHCLINFISLLLDDDRVLLTLSLASSSNFPRVFDHWLSR